MGNVDFIGCPYRAKGNKASAKWQSRVIPNLGRKCKGANVTQPPKPSEPPEPPLMKYTYAYKTSDGVRHEELNDRLRNLGVKLVPLE